MTEILRTDVRKFDFFHILIEKNTRYGIMLIQLVDTEGAGKTVILNLLWEIGATTDCNKTRRS